MAVPESLLAGFPVVIVLPVQWGDQDAFGHVNNTVYFRWCESSRIVYGNRIGLAEMKAARNIGPILAAIACNYRKQVTFPDTVHIGSRITRLGRSSMTMDHVIVSEAQQCVVADATSTIVTFDYAANKPIAVPAEVRAAIEQLEGRALT